MPRWFDFSLVRLCENYACVLAPRPFCRPPRHFVSRPWRRAMRPTQGRSGSLCNARPALALPRGTLFRPPLRFVYACRVQRVERQQQSEEFSSSSRGSSCQMFHSRRGRRPSASSRNRCFVGSTTGATHRELGFCLAGNGTSANHCFREGDDLPVVQPRCFRFDV